METRLTLRWSRPIKSAIFKSQRLTAAAQLHYYTLNTPCKDAIADQALPSLSLKRLDLLSMRLMSSLEDSDRVIAKVSPRSPILPMQTWIVSRVIGKVVESTTLTMILQSKLGTTRFLDKLSGKQLPKIC